MTKSRNKGQGALPSQRVSPMPGPPTLGCGNQGQGGVGGACESSTHPGNRPQPLNGSASGFPKSIKTREKLSEYLTVVIFTASAQHAAVNFGQVGKGRWALWAGNHQTTPDVGVGPPLFLVLQGRLQAVSVAGCLALLEWEKAWEATGPRPPCRARGGLLAEEVPTRDHGCPCSTTGAPGSPMLPQPCEPRHPQPRVWSPSSRSWPHCQTVAALAGIWVLCGR